METYLINFDFDKVVDYRIQQYYTGHRMALVTNNGNRKIYNICQKLTMKVTIKTHWVFADA